MSTLSERLKQEYNKLNKGDGFDNEIVRLKLPKTGEVRVRILPAKDYYLEDGTVNPEPSLFFKRFGAHWFNRKPYYCPQVTKGDDCPICKVSKKFYDADDKDRGREFRASNRALVNVVTVDDDDNITSGPQLFEMPKTLLTNVLEWCCDEEYDDLSDPQNGYTFRVIRKIGDNGLTEYSASRPMKNPTPIDDETMRGLLEQAIDIHSFVDKQVKSYEELENFIVEYMNGVDDVEEPSEPEKPQAVAINEDELIGRLGSL